MVPDRKLKGYWGVFLALGLASAPFAQELMQPTFEGEPIAEPRQDERAAQGDSNSGDHPTAPADPTSALKGIEAAIRDLVADNDQADRDSQSEREQRDLDAQVSMALWAQAMFWATLATVGTTLVGLTLIARTLVHTKRAADYASDMVEEARTTTEITSRILQADRAYLFYDDFEFVGYADPEAIDVRLGLMYNIYFKNTGKTPAIFARMGISGVTAPRGIIPLGIPSIEPSADGFSGVSVGPDHRSSTNPVKFGEEDIRASINGEMDLYISARTDYEDIFGNPRITEAFFRIEFSTTIENIMRPAAGSAIEYRRICALVPVGPHNRTT